MKCFVFFAITWAFVVAYHGEVVSKLVRNTFVFSFQVKTGFYLNLWLKKGIEERKLFLEHHQTVVPNARASQAVRGLFGCPSTNF